MAAKSVIACYLLFMSILAVHSIRFQSGFFPEELGLNTNNDFVRRQKQYLTDKLVLTAILSQPKLSDNEGRGSRTGQSIDDYPIVESLEESLLMKQLPTIPFQQRIIRSTSLFCGANPLACFTH